MFIKISTITAVLWILLDIIEIGYGSGLHNDDALDVMFRQRTHSDWEKVWHHESHSKCRDKLIRHLYWACEKDIYRLARRSSNTAENHRHGSNSNNNNNNNNVIERDHDSLFTITDDKNSQDRDLTTNELETDDRLNQIMDDDNHDNRYDYLLVKKRSSFAERTSHQWFGNVLQQQKMMLRTRRNRRRASDGSITAECCTRTGCTWEEYAEYCPSNKRHF